MHTPKGYSFGIAKRELDSVACKGRQGQAAAGSNVRAPGSARGRGTNGTTVPITGNFRSLDNLKQETGDVLLPSYTVLDVKARSHQ